MALALPRSMSSLDALHIAAPSLKQRRTQSHEVVVATRRRLAQKTPSQEMAAVAEPALTASEAEIYFDPNLTVVEESPRPRRARLAAALVFGVSCGAALASLVIA